MKKLVLLIFLFSSLGVFSQEKDIEYWRNAAFEAKTKGDLETSILNYKEVLKINQDDYDAKLALARLYYDKKEYSNSFFFYELIYSSDNEDIEAINGFGRIYFRKGEFNKAIFYFKKSVQLLPTYVPPYFDLSKSYIEKGELDSAQLTLLTINTIDNTYSEAWGGIGKIYYWQEKPYSAIPYLEKAIELDPENIVWEQTLARIKKTIAYNFSATYLLINEKEESYNIDAFVQKYSLSKRLTNRFDLSLNTLFDRSNRDYNDDSLDAKRWYDNSWAKLTYIRPNNRLSAYAGYSKSDARLTTYGMNWLSNFRLSKFKFKNSLTAGYDYYYYWNQVGKNSISEKFTTTYKKINLDLGFLYGEVSDNLIADYYLNVYDSIPNPHYGYSVSVKYQVLSNPKTFIGIGHSYLDFKYQSPKYYSPNERYLNGFYISTYYELKNFYFYADFSYNLGQETYYEEAVDGEFQGNNFRYDEFLNTNLNNWSTNIDFGYTIKNISMSLGGGHFDNPYYVNTIAYLALNAKF